MTNNRLIPLIATVLAIGGAAALLASCVGGVEDNESVTILSNGTWLALQESSGDWSVRESANTANDLNTYTFQVANEAGQYGLAIVCPTDVAGSHHVVTLFFGTTGELQRIRRGCETDPATKARRGLAGNLQGLASGEAAVVNLTDDQAAVYFGAYAEEVTTGDHDVLAYKGVYDGQGIDPLTFFIAREISVNKDENGTLGPQRFDIDFGAIQAFAADNATHQIQVSGNPLGSGESRWRSGVHFVSKNRNMLPLAVVDNPAAAFSYRGVPLYAATDTFQETPLQQQDEGHSVFAQAFDAQDRRTRESYRLFKRPADAAVALPALRNLAPAVAANGGTGYQILDLGWTVPAADAEFGAAVLYHWRLTGDHLGLGTDPAAGTRWHVYVTPGWLAAEAAAAARADDGSGSSQPADPAAAALTLPDFSGERGWSNRWGFSGVAGTWSIAALFSRDEATEVVDFLLHSNVTDGAAFGVVTQYNN